MTTRKRVKYWTISVYCGGQGHLVKRYPNLKIECREGGLCKGHKIIFNDPAEFTDIQWRYAEKVY